MINCPSSNRGIGDGVARAVVRRVLPIFIQDENIGLPVGPFVSITLHGAPEAITANRKVAMKTFGFLCLFHMFALGMGALPVSPFLLHAAIDGRGAFAFDKIFITELDPQRFDSDVLALMEGGLSIEKVFNNCRTVNALLSLPDQSVSPSGTGTSILLTDIGVYS